MNKRIAYLDSIRTLAIAMVIATHCSEFVFGSTLAHFLTLSTPNRIVGTVTFIFGRLGVPLFLLLSGHLMLDRPFDDCAIRRFYRKNVLGLLLATEIWQIIYFLFGKFYLDLPFRWAHLPLRLLFIIVDKASLYAPHLWYLPVIIGIYLFLPAIARAVQSLPKRLLGAVLVLMLFYEFLIPTLSRLTQLWAFKTYYTQLDLSFSGGYLGLMLLIGYYMKRYFTNRMSARALRICILITFGLAAGMQYTLNSSRIAFYAWYDTFPILICAISLFLYFSCTDAKPSALSGLKANIAQCAFGIYLIHYLILYLIRDAFLVIPVLIVRFSALFTVTFALSFLAVFALRKIPRLSGWLFSA